MKFFKRANEQGLSLKKTFTVMLIVFFTITALLMIVSVRMILSFHNLADTAAELFKSSTAISVSDYHTLEDRAHMDLVWTIVLIVVEAVVIALMLRLISRFGVNPVLHAAECIKRNGELEVTGSTEFRYVAQSYNKMFDAYTHNVANLPYLASHDELTDVYNRAGYDLISETVDLTTTGFILLDVDNFNEINDTYGQEVGDIILKRIVAMLNRNFRTNDYICRLSGDEFIVLMVDIDDDCKRLIERKVEQINRDLSSIDDGLPKVTLSAGVSLCNKSGEPQNALREANVALSQIKDKCYGGCCFYTPAFEEKTQID